MATDSKNTATDLRPPIRQVWVPCPHCGSRYRRGDRCNICGALALVPQEPEQAGKTRMFHKYGKNFSKEKKVRY